MSRKAGILLGLLFGLVTAAPAAAQYDREDEYDETPSTRAVVLLGHLGGFNALSSLNDAGTADFKKTGWSWGLGAGYELNPNLMLRGDFTMARNELRVNGVPTGTDLKRYFVDGTLQFQASSAASSVQPYLFLGGGLVRLHQVGLDGGTDATRAAGTAGIGFNYMIPRSDFGIFAEGKGWVYELDEASPGSVLAGIDETQVEMIWSGGITYRFRY